MGLLDLIGRKRARDKPQNSYEGQDFFYLFGRTTSGENVDEFKGIKVEFIQLSNKNIFDVLEKDLSKKLRFEDISIEAILGKYLCNNDIEIIKYLYEKDKINSRDELYTNYLSIQTSLLKNTPSSMKLETEYFCLSIPLNEQLYRKVIGCLE